MCSATSKVLLSAGSWTIVHPKSHGTRIRWPLLETGANSVMPWTRPSTIAWRIVTRFPSGRRRGESIRTVPAVEPPRTATAMEML